MKLTVTDKYLIRESYYVSKSFQVKTLTKYRIEARPRSWSSFLSDFRYEGKYPKDVVFTSIFNGSAVCSEGYGWHLPSLTQIGLMKLN